MLFFLLLRSADLGTAGEVGWLVYAEVRAQVIDEGVAILRVDQGSPLRHLVDFLGPSGFREALLDDDAGFVALGAGGGGFGLHRAGREFAVGLGLQDWCGERREQKGGDADGLRESVGL